MNTSKLDIAIEALRALNDQYKALRVLLESHNVQPQCRIYLGADADATLPRELGGRWTLIDDYSTSHKAIDVAEAMPEGRYLKILSKSGTEVYTPKSLFIPSLVVYRRAKKAYAHLVGKYLLCVTPHIVTDFPTTNSDATPELSDKVLKELERLGVVASRQLFLH